jgi:2-aminoethylphosphonate-pyruvate transaminase
MKLLNPGPVTLTKRVRAAFDCPDVCHRETEFATLTKGVIDKLSRVYPAGQASHVPVLLSGSGTAAVEALLGSLTPKDGRTLVVANGVYGERAAAMLKAQGKAFDMVQSPWLEAMNLAEVESKLKAGGYTHVFAVHHETTTGRLNRVDQLGALCKQYNVPMLLDAVSSFAGEHIAFDAWNLEGLAATANKCLHGVPGIAFCLVRKQVFESRSTGATSVYLDLFRYEKEQRTGFSPFTQATHVMFALSVALDELSDQGGVEARIAHYQSLTRKVTEDLGAMGVSLLIEGDGVHSSTLTSFKLPAGVSYDRLHDELKAAGFIIYAGQGDFRGSIFRIAVMGDLGQPDVERLTARIRSILRG